MAGTSQSAAQLDPQMISCSLCLDVLTDPVTTSCGHSYCRKCLQHHWNAEKEKRVYSCPQCRRTFKPRPVLEKNTMLAALVETLGKTGLQASPADCCYAGTICGLCCMDEHQGHCTTAAAAERSERQRELEKTRQKIKRKIQHTQEDLKVLQKEVESIDSSADEAVKDSKDILTQMILLLEKRRTEVQQQVRSTQGAAVSRVKELQKKLEQEMMELKRRDAELEKISHTLDHSQFLYRLSSFPALSLSPDSSSLEIRPLKYFEDVAAAVTKLRDKIQQVLIETQTNISWTVSNVDVLLKEPEPRTREDFLRYSPQITLDPNTVNKHLLLSEENRKVTHVDVQSYCDHPDRFTDWRQVLSREGLTGRCYWEVERGGRERVEVAMAYRNISRAGRSEEIAFGLNEESWCLYCSSGRYEFQHNTIRTDISAPHCSRVGVYLDHRAGLLSFYSVSGTMVLLYRVQTSFTQPLHVGFGVHSGSSVKLMKV